MRLNVTRERLQGFLEALGAKAQHDTRLYLTGGATAVSFGWRESTADVDVKIVPDRDDVLRAIPALKEALSISVEPAAPDDFIPVKPGWEDRSRFVGQFGRLSVYHFDFYAQALSKIERGHHQDLNDVRMMVEYELIEPTRLLTEFEAIVPFLYRYSALDENSFRRAVASFVEGERSTKS